eukprot:Lankesteria_metandrocarpae@DN11041_c0_g1_i1.p1
MLTDRDFSPLAFVEVVVMNESGMDALMVHKIHDLCGRKYVNIFVSVPRNFLKRAYCALNNTTFNSDCAWHITYPNDATEYSFWNYASENPSYSYSAQKESLRHQLLVSSDCIPYYEVADAAVIMMQPHVWFYKQVSRRMSMYQRMIIVLHHSDLENKRFVSNLYTWAKPITANLPSIIERKYRDLS